MENPARRPWTVGMWQIDNESVGKRWTDSLSIIDADGGEVAVTTRGYEGDANGDGCPSWKNAVLIVSAVNAFIDGETDEAEWLRKVIREYVDVMSRPNRTGEDAKRAFAALKTAINI